MRFSAVYGVGGPRSLPLFTPETGVGSRAKNRSFKRCQYKYDPVKKGEAVDESIFETSQKVILDNVINFFGCYSGKTLERFTHMERPWLQTRSGLPMFENSGRIIPKELIKEYFTEVKEKFNMLHPGDIGKYSEDLFEKIRRF